MIDILINPSVVSFASILNMMPEAALPLESFFTIIIRTNVINNFRLGLIEFNNMDFFFAVDLFNMGLDGPSPGGLVRTVEALVPRRLSAVVPDVGS